MVKFLWIHTLAPGEAGIRHEPRWSRPRAFLPSSLSPGTVTWGGQRQGRLEAWHQGCQTRLGNHTSHTPFPAPPPPATGGQRGRESLCIIIESGRMNESHIHLFLKLVTSEKQDEASFDHCCVSSPFCVQSGTGRQGLSSGDMREEKVVPGQRDGMGWAWKQGWPSEEQNLEVQGS